MRTLAKNTFGLNILDSGLPAKKIESGIDIMDIIKNFSNFI